jgi:uncharacterized protein
MEFSKHNIFSRIADSDNYFIVNPLSGNADILEPHEARAFKEKEHLNDFIEKGYLVDPKAEQQLFKQKYLNFLDERDSDEVQIFFTPWYTCNFNCSYCFQDEYTNPNEGVKHEVIDGFFAYIDQKFAGRQKYITIFGGEPLLNSPVKRESIQKVIEGANARNLDIAIVTNGYHIVEYIDLLKEASIREIQVTLDGTQQVHDARRMLRGGKGSFERIAEGIDLLLKHHIPVNLRMIIDKENIHDLPEFAQFAIKRGWTSNQYFKTAFGRNYELHHCQTNNARLFSRIEMYQNIYQIIKEHPKVLEFHKPAFSIAKFIFENGELPNPLFDSCTGAKTEWAFDYTGRIYSCTATVGNEGDELGTFYPNIALNEELIEEWEERDVLSIKECTDCPVRLACGGGCAAVAKTRTGKIQSPDCRPIQGLLEFGIGLYSELNIEEYHERDYA